MSRSRPRPRRRCDWRRSRCLVEPGVRVTATLGTPLPPPSSNFTWTGGVNVAPAVTVAGGCWEKTILPGDPAVFVSWKDTESTPTPAVTVEKVPAVPLAVIGDSALPSASVTIFAIVDPLNSPLAPDGGAVKATVAPLTGFRDWSSTNTVLTAYGVRGQEQ